MVWQLPGLWNEILAEELRQPYFVQLYQFLLEERHQHVVQPADEDVFRALALTPYANVRVVLLGQDPYHDDGQAHGLCFSVRPGVRFPPTLGNIFRELHADVGVPVPQHGCLEAWARQGVLLLNTVLTVRAHQPYSHRGLGWERFTDAIIRRIAEKPEPVVFVLWGRPAQKKAPLVCGAQHTVVAAPHPSPLSAHRGFFGSRPFSAIDRALAAGHLPPVDWRVTGDRSE